jgi:hypothetical protein
MGSFQFHHSRIWIIGQQAVNFPQLLPIKAGMLQGVRHSSTNQSSQQKGETVIRKQQK